MLVWAENDPGAIGARAIWVDLSVVGPPWPMYIRNRWNDGWLEFNGAFADGREKSVTIQLGSELVGTPVLAVQLYRMLTWEFAGVITAVRLMTDGNTNLTLDLVKDTYTNYPPTGADSICASDKLILVAAQKLYKTTFTGWTLAFAAGDVLWADLEVNSAAKYIELSITYLRTD